MALGETPRKGPVHWQEKLEVAKQTVGEDRKGVRQAFMKCKAENRAWADSFGSSLFAAFAASAKLRPRAPLRGKEEFRQGADARSDIAYLGPQGYSSLGKLGRRRPSKLSGAQGEIQALEGLQGEAPRRAGFFVEILSYDVGGSFCEDALPRRLKILVRPRAYADSFDAVAVSGKSR